MNTEYIHVEENDGVLFIKMDDPKTRNALGSDMSDEITDQLDGLVVKIPLKQTKLNND